MSHRSERPVHHPDTASRVFSGEAVVITPAENTVRMFNRSGSRIWELMDGDRGIADIAEVLTTEYRIDGDRALVSVQRFVEQLVAKGLVSFSAGAT